MSDPILTQLEDINAELNTALTDVETTGLTPDDTANILSATIDLPILDTQAAVDLGDPDALLEANIDTNLLSELSVCFLSGTHILTERGEIPVEKLAVGDRVITPHGAEASMPIRWIGRQHYEGHTARFVQPVRIRAGAIGNGIPHRDLLLSGDHHLFLEGRLVPAKLLVNGVSIMAETGHDVVDYINIELDSHNAVLAEGVALETYLDCGNRHRFHSTEGKPVTHAGTDTAWTAGAAFAPPLWDGPELTALNERLTQAVRTKLAA